MIDRIIPINFGLKMFDLWAKIALNEFPEYSKSLFDDRATISFSIDNIFDII